MRFRGFTLIEVMVALAIFAMVAVILGATYVNVLIAYKVVNQSDVYEQEVRFARAQLMAEPDRVKAEEGGSFDGANGTRVTWKAEIDTGPIADVFEVAFTCDVSDPAAKEQIKPITETFMLLRPTWSEGIDMTRLRQQAKDRIVEMRRKKA